MTRILGAMDMVKIRANVAAHGMRKNAEVTVAETPIVAGGINSGVFTLLEHIPAPTTDPEPDEPTHPEPDDEPEPEIEDVELPASADVHDLEPGPDDPGGIESHTRRPRRG